MMPKPLLVLAVLMTLALNMGCANSSQAPSQPNVTQTSATSPALAKLDKAIETQKAEIAHINQQVAEMEAARDKARSTDPVHDEEVERLESELEGLTEGLAHMEDALNTLQEQRVALTKSAKP